MPKHPKDTALHRTGPSAPLRWLLQGAHLPPPKNLVPGPNGYDHPVILDYGCGHGADVQHLWSLDYDADGYDPAWRPHLDVQRNAYDVVLCTYVLNVILDEFERQVVLNTLQAALKPGGVAFVTVRRDIDADTETQHRIVLDFPTLVDGTGFAIYHITKPTAA